MDAAPPFYRALGFRLTDRWGPPFAIVKRKGLSLWLSGPGTSAVIILTGDTPIDSGPRRVLFGSTRAIYQCAFTRLRESRTRPLVDRGRRAPQLG